MKKLLLLSFFCGSLLTMNAQSTNTETFPQTVSVSVRFGYVSYNAIMQKMPEYKQMVDDINKIEESYKEEAKRVEEEFNSKYEDYVEGLEKFPENIRIKRQAELRDLMDKNLQFRQESERLLKEVTTERKKKITDRLHEAIAKSAKELGLPFVLNTDGDNCPYVDNTQGVDISNRVLWHLR